MSCQEPPEILTQAADILTQARSLRERSPNEAIDKLSESLEQLSGSLGTNVHPSLGFLWLEYGDLLLLQQEEALNRHVNEPLERTVGETTARNSVGSTEANGILTENALERSGAEGNACPLSIAGNVAELSRCLESALKRSMHNTKMEDLGFDNSGEDDEQDDLLLAYESLMIARQCLETQPEEPSILRARAQIHRRLADFKMLQMHSIDAVAESQASLALVRQASRKDGSLPEEHEDARRVQSEVRHSKIRDALAHLTALVELSQQPVETVITQGDDVLVLLREFRSQSGQEDPSHVTLDSSKDDSAKQSLPAQEVSVRSRKRKLESEDH